VAGWRVFVSHQAFEPPRCQPYGNGVKDVEACGRQASNSCMVAEKKQDLHTYHQHSVAAVVMVR